MLSLVQIRDEALAVVSAAIAPAKVRDLDLREIADSEGEAALEVRVAADPLSGDAAGTRGRAGLRLQSRLNELGEPRYPYLNFVGTTLVDEDEAA